MIESGYKIIRSELAFMYFLLLDGLGRIRSFASKLGKEFLETYPSKKSSVAVIIFTPVVLTNSSEADTPRFNVKSFRKVYLL